jgi:hypothetical protein
VATFTAGDKELRGVPFSLRGQDEKKTVHVVTITKGRQQGTSNPASVLQVGVDGKAYMSLTIDADGNLQAGQYAEEPEPTAEEQAAKKGGRPKKAAPEADAEAAAPEA